MLRIVLLAIIFTIALILIRLIKGKSIWEKLLALNLFAILTVMMIVTYAVEKNWVLVMDIAIAYSIIGFLSLILLTKFIAGGKDDR
jgi:multicomponent Na+:H+ antiporter subunit F